MTRVNFPQPQAGLHLPCTSEAADSGEPLDGSGFEHEIPDDGFYPIEAEGEGEQHAG